MKMVVYEIKISELELLCNDSDKALAELVRARLKIAGYVPVKKSIEKILRPSSETY